MSGLKLRERIRLRNKQRKLLDRCIKVNRTDRIHLEILRICITYHCNRNCSFCYAEGLQKEFKDNMSLEDFDFLCNWAKEQGYKSLRFLGGEPTVHPQFKTILEIAGRYGFTISLSSNGFFDSRTSSLFEKGFIESINFSYPQDQISSQDLDIFTKNIEDTIAKEIPVVISGVVYPDRDDWRKVVDLAIRFQRKPISRFSMIIPGHSRDFKIEEFRNYLNGLAHQIMEVARYAYKNYVVFYFYRPLMPCLFKKNEIRFLNLISRSLFDSFCACSCIEGTMPTVNPDLSCFPCPSLSIKGIKITADINREKLQRYFRDNLAQLALEPLMEQCQLCPYFTNYKNYLKNNVSGGIMCHGGCYCYRT